MQAVFVPKYQSVWSKMDVIHIILIVCGILNCIAKTQSQGNQVVEETTFAAEDYGNDAAVDINMDVEVEKRTGKKKWSLEVILISKFEILRGPRNTRFKKKEYRSFRWWFPFLVFGIHRDGYTRNIEPTHGSSKQGKSWNSIDPAKHKTLKE